MRNLINRWNFQTILVKFPKYCDLLQYACTSGFDLFGIKTFTPSSEEYCGWVNKYERAPLAASFKCSGNVHKLQSVTCDVPTKLNEPQSHAAATFSRTDL